jgi:hypothetical protein
MEAFQQRVVDERNEVQERRMKLTAFLGGGIFEKLPIAEQNRLIHQARIMEQYVDVLSERIEAFQ